MDPHGSPDGAQLTRERLRPKPSVSGNPLLEKGRDVAPFIGFQRSRQLLDAAKRRLWPATLMVFPAIGSRRRLTPISRFWGMDRGLPIDRHYIEAFVSQNAKDVHGSVLEIEDDRYTKAYGRNVTKSDILHVSERYPGVTIIADLTTGDGIDSDVFDCVIITQTLQLIYDSRSAIATLHRILKPGGVVIATFPGISPIAHEEGARWNDHWRFTKASSENLFSEIFGGENVVVQSYGNVLAASAFLYGLSVEELREWELDFHDPDYEVLIAVRAVKSG
jgi:SAM-dependent methyltransferase